MDPDKGISTDDVIGMTDPEKDVTRPRLGVLQEDKWRQVRWLVVGEMGVQLGP